jgi:hypothetical protein
LNIPEYQEVGCSSEGVEILCRDIVLRFGKRIRPVRAVSKGGNESIQKEEK